VSEAAALVDALTEPTDESRARMAAKYALQLKHKLATYSPQRPHSSAAALPRPPPLERTGRAAMYALMWREGGQGGRGDGGRVQGQDGHRAAGDPARCRCTRRRRTRTLARSAGVCLGWGGLDRGRLGTHGRLRPPQPTLESILRLDKLQGETGASLLRLWAAYHDSKGGYVAGGLTGAMHATLRPHVAACPHVRCG
jgi:hypothetical protein